MPRKIDPKKINLRIDNIELNHNEVTNKDILTFSWSSDIGFGEYAFYRAFDPIKYAEFRKDPYGSNYHNDNPWIADSEYMDSNDNKEFGQELLNLWMQSVNIK